MENDMNKKIKKMRELKDRREEIAAEDKELKKEYDALAKSLGEELVEAGLDQVKVEGAGIVKPTEELKTWITDKEKLLAYLKENGHDGIIETEYIGWQRLLSWAKEMREDDEDLNNVSGMGHSISVVASLTRK